MLTLTNVSVRLGGHPILEGASASLSRGWRVGLVGRNGAGKSTLLDVIAGTLHPDTGDVTLAGRVRIGLVAQEAPGGTTTPLEAVLAADVERHELLAEAEHADGHRLGEIHERLAMIAADSAPARAATILFGLGFDAEAQSRPLSSFSGGWRMRVALAAALFAEPDLLLLDEPTNHLDLEASLWLEAFLKRWPRGLILVSHDRNLLNSVPTHILHLNDGQLTLYPGDYDRFERVRAERMEHASALAARQAATARHLQSFVDRFRAKATKARQAQSRLKMLERLKQDAVTIERDDPAIRLHFPDPGALKPPIIAIENASVGYVPGKPVLRRLNLRLDPEDRVALVGANGNGKSTLAKLLAGRLAPETGTAQRAPKLEVGFFAQHQIEEMRPERSAYHHLEAILPRDTPEQLRTRLGGFGFSGDKADLPVSELSGGERARLNFALITAHKPALLLLDEPTNHLDIPSREALVDAINDFAGAVVLVTHDLHLIELTMDRLWLVADGKVTSFEGDVEEYRRLVLGERSARGDGAKRGDAGPSAKDERRAAAERRQALAPLRNQAKTAEAELARLSKEREKLEAEFADPALYADAARATALAKRRAELNAAIAATEERWLEAAEALEAAERVAS
ncbi:MAG: ABC-F family ATP-binding cassette domain-containing protein [Alphaproteobacteria bacterium]|nr:ABC-F family ATP-binding cassette domain-containing protein [Alphaproteobacteria bacterium]